MKKAVLSILILIFLLAACKGGNEFETIQEGTENKETQEVNTGPESEEIYSGPALRIGVIGEKPKKNFPNVTFTSVESNSLKDPSYDAYFITNQYFEELSTDDWVPVFSTIQTPVFFVNLNAKSFIYKVEGMTYDPTNPQPESNSHTEGFVHTGDQSKRFGYGDPTSSTNVEDTPDLIFYKIFKDIGQYVKDTKAQSTKKKKSNPI
ncbi:hypothetical protein KO561_14150 [Radiobacillus kanasensis]|uniref:hypothetical protein n=1 Tax=Radiobacillus kanasensis TaxID=2844358 RepID=UPI001E4782FD|nr:hypothetical protein [Radiobacillus kanasensis]UFT98337.1 hypothetical protein KO561_14150 [Radiobacillus kanasensis]